MSVNRPYHTNYPSAPRGMSGVQKFIAWWLLLVLMWVWGGAAVIQSKISKAIKNTPDGYELYEGLKQSVEHSTLIYWNDKIDRNDKSGKLLAELWWKWASYVSIDQMNPLLVSCLIGVEDQRFREHNWFDTKALRGMIRDMLRWNVRWWSTIASQLFKPEQAATDSRERSEEKIDEWVKAFKVLGVSDEQMKWFVLEYYLNTTEFVTNTKGIQAAAQILFWKDQKDLELDEAAMIVGLAQNPSRINPISTESDRRERAERRTDEVLRDLIRAVEEWAFPDHFFKKYPELSDKLQDISSAIAPSTLSKVKKNPSKRLSRVNMIAHGTAELITEAKYQLDREIQENGINLNGKSTDITTWWFKLKTTIDPQLQEWILNHVQTFLWSVDKKRPHPKYPLDCSVLVVDNATGAVRADMRWRDFSKSELDFRRSLTEKWSVIKAVVDACALELGIISSLDEAYVDQSYTLTSDEYSGITDKDGWTPDNFEDKEYGAQTMTIGEATLVKSLNKAIASLFKKAAEQWKWQAFIDLLQSKLLAVSIVLPDHLQNNPQIGIWLWSWNLDQIAKLYMAIANWWFAPESFHTLSEIRDDQDGLLYKYNETNQTPTISLYSTEVVVQLSSYLEQKWKQVTGYDNCLGKSWTTPTQLWMVVSTPGVTMVVRLWPHVYSDGKGNIIGRGNGKGLDATTILRPLIKNICALLESEWYIDKNAKFSFSIPVTETPKTDSLQVQEPVEREME